MRRTSFLVSALIAATSFAQQASPPADAPKAEPAQPPAWYERVKISGKTYLRYSFELGQAAFGRNELAIDRLYLQTEFLPADNIRFQVTLDAGDSRENPASGSARPFFAETKYAFVEVKDLVAKGLYLRGGILPLAWVPNEEDLWTFRLQGPVPVDRWGYLTSADLGVAFGGALPAKYGSFQLNVGNGEGYKSPELGKGKELQGRLTVNPLASMGGVPAGLFLSLAGVWGHYDGPGIPPAARTRLRGIAQVGLQTAPLTVAAEYVRAVDPRSKLTSRYNVGPEDSVSGNLLSAFAVFDAGALSKAVGGLQLIARVDYLDPDTTLARNEESLWIGGVSYKWAPFAKTLLDYEAVLYGPDAAGSGTNKPREERLKLQTEVRF